MNHLDPQAAAEYLQSAFATQRDDGMIPLRARPDGWRSEGSEAPLLCWAAWTNHRFTEDAKDLRRALHHGARALDWDLSHFDGDADGLLEEHFAAPGDAGAPFDSLAFSVCAAEDMRHLSLIAEELGEGDSAERWQLRARRMRESIHELRWDAERGIYVEGGSDGDSAAPGALAGALPLLLPDLASDRVERLVALVDDALQRDQPWRGAERIDLGWLVVEGLRRHGRRQQAAALGERLIALMQGGYEGRGRIIPPGQRSVDAVADEHTTAALCFLLLLDDC
jgi:hypothetical protein